MFTYDGGHLTQSQLIKFEESMTFSDAEGYSKNDTDRILRHLSVCAECRKRRGYAIRGWFEQHELTQLAR